MHATGFCQFIRRMLSLGSMSHYLLKAIMHVQLKISSGITQLLQSFAQQPQNHFEQTKKVCYRAFGLQTPKSCHYQRKTNNRAQGLIELQHIQLTLMRSDTPPTLEEPVSNPTSLKYSPINNQINNIKIILFNIKFQGRNFRDEPAELRAWACCENHCI